jgi:hypothetical protein
MPSFNIPLRKTSLSIPKRYTKKPLKTKRQEQNLRKQSSIGRYTMTSLPERHVSITVSTIKDQIASLMYAFGVVNDNEDIIDIRFGYKRVMDTDEELIPIILKIRNRNTTEVKIITHNGT